MKLIKSKLIWLNLIFNDTGDGTTGKSYESLGAKIDISIYVHIYISKCVDLNIA